jgi:hypothetical protein
VQYKNKTQHKQLISGARPSDKQKPAYALRGFLAEFLLYVDLIDIFFTPGPGLSLGKVIFNTPFLKVASTLSRSTSCGS